MSHCVLLNNSLDFKLVVINAANDGFQSKMNTATGSYVITRFVKKIRKNVFEGHNKRFLHEILDDIQENLHDLGKQLMVKTYNNKTEWIKFVKNERGKPKTTLSLSMSMSFSRRKGRTESGSGSGSGLETRLLEPTDVELPTVTDRYQLLV